MTVDDVAHDAIFAETPAQKVLLNAGVRAVQSTPLLGTNGKVLVVLSTHYRKHCLPTTYELGKIDQLAEGAGILIEREVSPNPQAAEPSQPEQRSFTDSYSLFCRTHEFVSFVRSIQSWNDALALMERLSRLEPSEFILCRDLTVAAISYRGILEVRSGNETPVTPPPLNIPLFPVKPFPAPRDSQITLYGFLTCAR